METIIGTLMAAETSLNLGLDLQSSQYLVRNFLKVYIFGLEGLDKNSSNHKT